MPLMHLKSYQIDGRLLRTGAANFSASGDKRQDNDLIVIEGTEATAAFREIRNCPIGQELPPVMGVAVTGWIALKASPFSVGRCKQN